MQVEKTDGTKWNTNSANRRKNMRTNVWFLNWLSTGALKYFTRHTRAQWKFNGTKKLHNNNWLYDMSHEARTQNASLFIVIWFRASRQFRLPKPFLSSFLCFNRFWLLRILPAHFSSKMLVLFIVSLIIINPFFLFFKLVYNIRFQQSLRIKQYFLLFTITIITKFELNTITHSTFEIVHVFVRAGKWGAKTSKTLRNAN